MSTSIHPVSLLENGPVVVTKADVEAAGDDGLKVVHFTLYAPPDTLVLAVDHNGEVGPFDPELRRVAYLAEARFSPQLYGLEHCKCCGEPPDVQWPMAFCVKWREDLPTLLYQKALAAIVDMAPYDYCSSLIKVENRRFRVA